LASPVLAWPLGSLALSKGVVVEIFLFVTASDHAIKMLERNSIQSEAILS
jgi:hypothetical protein